jgi:hypothetical protein
MHILLEHRILRSHPADFNMHGLHGGLLGLPVRHYLPEVQCRQVPARGSHFLPELRCGLLHMQWGSFHKLSILRPFFYH